MESIPLPSQRILEAIEWDERTGLSQVLEARVPRSREGHPDHVGCSIATGLTHQIKFFYLALENGRQLSSQRIIDVIKEGVRNQIQHAPESLVRVRLVLGKPGAAYGFRDDGDYFKDERTKKQWEAKREITKFDREGGHLRFGVNNLVFEYSDIIEVDTETGTLYCAQLLSSLQE